MAKQSFPMHLYAKQDYLSEEVTFQLHRWDGMGDSAGIYIGPVTVDAEVPEHFDLRAAKLRDKQAELTKVRAEFTARITQLQREVNELQAIEMTA